MNDRDFEKALVAEHKFLLSYACKKFGQKGEDLTQSALLKAWAARGSYTDDGKMRSWLIMILVRVMYSEHRRSWRLSFHDDMTAFEVVEPSNQEDHVYLNQVLTTMTTLSLGHLDVVILAARGASYEDAADDLCILEGTVKSRLHRGRAVLREKLGVAASS